jgi:predicted kinase
VPLECAVFTGLQASGKTTFYRARCASTHLHVSKDNLASARNRQARQMRMIEEALREGLSVVVDNTNPTPADREPLVSVALRYGAEAVAYYFDAGVPDCLARNRKRKGRARVPDVAIFVAAAKLVPPSPEEGFDRIFSVRILEGGRFRVSRLTPSLPLP